MSNIKIIKKNITVLPVDAIVNAANEGLWAGGGVCGAIFSAAGRRELQDACDRIGHCDTGKAVITPGFHLPAKYIIHTVGPVWRGGNHDEERLLKSCYMESLKLARENDIHTIAFPLISAGIFGVPLDIAWKAAIRGVWKYLDNHPDEDMDVTFACLDDHVIRVGETVRGELKGLSHDS